MLLRPQRIHLIFTEETKAVRRRLSDCLRGSGSGIEVVDKPEYQLGDAIDVQKIRGIVTHLPDNAGLNYTGGTKTMATHIHAQWLASRGGKDSFASYLDDRGGQLRWDDGTTQPLQIQLNLDALCRLHGLRHKERTKVEGGPTDIQVVAMAIALTNPPSRAACLYNRLRADGKLISQKDFKDKPLTRADLDTLGCQSLSDPIPEQSWKKERIDGWAKVLSSDWLEEVVAHLVKQPALPGTSVHVGVNAWDEQYEKPPQDGCHFEVDVLVLRGHRLYAISCTTESARNDLCKSKLFEVALRARQLGGDLTRFAFVCLLGQTNQGEEKSAILERQARSAWDAPNKPRVFGLSHVRNWLAGNSSDLQEWLES
jgi:hypothetical protein